jgi:uncharacterized membrane protein YeaQ/YmgE (transglycosylase-associated protein family)
MGIVVWIVLGLGAGLLANMLIPGRRSQGLISTWLTAIVGAAILLLAYHLVTSRGNAGHSRRRAGFVAR